MSQTQKETLHCPECGAPISAVLQQLSGWALLTSGNVCITGDKSHPRADNVLFEYAGGTEVDWDSQMDHPEGWVKCDNNHITPLSDCEVREPAPEPFPYAEASVTRTRVWRVDEYLNYCKENDQTPTADDFVNWVREDMEASGDFPNDDVHNFSVELKRRPDS